jgi:hypothetical protein
VIWRMGGGGEGDGLEGGHCRGEGVRADGCLAGKCQIPCLPLIGQTDTPTPDRTQTTVVSKAETGVESRTCVETHMSIQARGAGQ